MKALDRKTKTNVSFYVFIAAKRFLKAQAKGTVNRISLQTMRRNQKLKANTNKEV